MSAILLTVKLIAKALPNNGFKSESSSDVAEIFGKNRYVGGLEFSSVSICGGSVTKLFFEFFRLLDYLFHFKTLEF